MTLQAIQNFLQSAIECSYFICPRDPGLSYEELHEISQRANYYRGETDDAISRLDVEYGANRRALLGRHALIQWKFFFCEEPDYRNMDAFDFVFAELNQRVREDGVGQAQIQRDVLTEKASARGISQLDMDVAITCLIGAEYISERDQYLRFAGTYSSVRQLPSESRRQAGGKHQRPERAKAYPLVKDIIERRVDGRLPSIEAFDAFAHQLGRLGYGPFRMWWKQTVAEMKTRDPAQAPASVTVLAAALVEGCLTFVVRHARNLDLPVFKSSDFDRSPHTWKIDDLVNSAAAGGSDAILDAPTKALAQSLIRNRQRIHAGRMLVDHPQGVPDVKSDEVRLAKATAEQVVRRVLDWLERHPPG